MVRQAADRHLPDVAVRGEEIALAVLERGIDAVLSVEQSLRRRKALPGPIFDVEVVETIGE